jgi:hypothetical protein
MTRAKKEEKKKALREELLKKALSDPKMLRKLGEAMAAPIRRTLGYSGIGRAMMGVAETRIFTPEELEEERIARKSW